MARWERGAYRVLHVDDEPGFAETVGALLEARDERLAVTPVTDGQTVLDRLAEGGFDAVISDYDMPDIDGHDLLKAVRADWPDLPFVLFTGKGSEEIASRAISAGVTDYLQKGGGTDQYDVLANRVANAASGWRATRQIERDHEAMNTAWDGLATLDREGHFTYVNDAYAETFGHDPAELIGTHWRTVYPDEDRSAVDEEILPALRHAGTWSGERRLVRDDEGEFVGEQTVAAIEDHGFACVIRDRTERRELDRDLRHERERFRLLVDAIDEYAMFMLDPDGLVTSWNAGAERIKGYAPEEILEEHVSTFYTERDREAGLPERLLAEAAESGTARDEGERVGADGSTFWADVTITALRENGDLRGFANVTKDVSERKERERRQERTERYRKRLYEITTDPERDVEAKIGDVLQLGVEYLEVDHGHVVAVDPETDYHEFIAVSGPHPQAEAGLETPLSESYCRRTIRADDMIMLYDAAEQGWAEDVAYEKWGFACYIGAKLEVDGELFGTTCFVDRVAREAPSRQAEKTFVELLTRWLTLELSRRAGEIEWPIAPGETESA